MRISLSNLYNSNLEFKYENIEFLSSKLKYSGDQSDLENLKNLGEYLGGQDLKGKRVLDMNSGCSGILGLYCLSQLNVQQVVFSTDSALLDSHIQENIILNDFTQSSQLLRLKLGVENLPLFLNSLSQPIDIIIMTEPILYCSIEYLLELFSTVSSLIQFQRHQFINHHCYFLITYNVNENNQFPIDKIVEISKQFTFKFQLNHTNNSLKILKFHI
ncbi:hypothetical protein DLAC_02410 [Tieghemostelium lacteum]|uniref:Uncharacterized protein n=1 Tax=Tieghemostelium lacteum TaxID=361077 RepID=A0A152A4W5_TIELA|nr:hypothetical protein DLAC_02410 [Tieghemostelium lacteum]|eukprot:KYR01286.1 hypothetical protein DLAC_02410 [Tieghemostelium lacteum]